MIKLNATDIIKENKEPKASQVKQETPQEQSEATSRPDCLLYTSPSPRDS